MNLAPSAEKPAEDYDAVVFYEGRYSETVNRLVDALNRGARVKMWRYQEVLNPGLWKKKVQEALEHVNCCLVCLGEETPGENLTNEIQEALRRAIDEQGKFKLIPVILPDICHPVVPKELEAYDIVDLAKADDKVLNGLRENIIAANAERSQLIRNLLLLKELYDGALILADAFSRAQEQVVMKYINRKGMR
jgi:hypothetical protein